MPLRGKSVPSKESNRPAGGQCTLNSNRYGDAVRQHFTPDVGHIALRQAHFPSERAQYPVDSLQSCEMRDGLKVHIDPEYVNEAYIMFHMAVEVFIKIRILERWTFS